MRNFSVKCDERVVAIAQRPLIIIKTYNYREQIIDENNKTKSRITEVT